MYRNTIFYWENNDIANLRDVIFEVKDSYKEEHAVIQQMINPLSVGVGATLDHEERIVKLEETIFVGAAPRLNTNVS